MDEFSDPDGYYEPEGPEISGPVSPTRVHAVVRRALKLIYPVSRFVRSARETAFARPLRTGPPT